MNLPELKTLPTQEEVDELRAQVGKLEQKYNAVMELAKHRSKSINGLMAQAAKMKSMLKDWQTWLGSHRRMCDESGKRLWDKIDEACNSTPAQCLAEIKVQAVEDARESYNEALEFALSNRDLDFLHCWVEGNWEAINDEWPEFNIHSEAQAKLMRDSGYDANQLRQQSQEKAQ